MKATDLLAGADWATPIYNMIRNKAQGGMTIRVSAALGIPDPGGILQENGIPVWGKAFYDNEYLFSFPRRYATLAEVILKRETGLVLEDTKPGATWVWWLLLAGIGGGIVWLTVAGLVVWR